jgi:hypothetical protein
VNACIGRARAPYFVKIFGRGVICNFQALLLRRLGKSISRVPGDPTWLQIYSWSLVRPFDGGRDAWALGSRRRRRESVDWFSALVDRLLLFVSQKASNGGGTLKVWKGEGDNGGCLTTLPRPILLSVALYK